MEPRFVNGPGPCVDYLTMNTQKLKDPDVRHAIALAIDRQGIQSIYGGEIGGTVADSVIPSDIPGYVAPDLGLSPPAIPTRRRSCSRASPYRRCTWGCSDEAGAAAVKEADQIEANLKAVGLEVVVDPRPDEDLSTIVDGDDAPDLSYGAWCFDWPTAASVVVPLLDPMPTAPAGDRATRPNTSIRSSQINSRS